LQVLYRYFAISLKSEKPNWSMFSLKALPDKNTDRRLIACCFLILLHYPRYTLSFLQAARWFLLALTYYYPRKAHALKTLEDKVHHLKKGFLMHQYGSLYRYHYNPRYN